MSKHRSWVFTVNNYTPEDEQRIQRFATAHSKWCIYGRELAPSTGTPHLQGAITLINAIGFNSLKRNIHPSAHLEVMVKEAKTNQDYCKKDDNYWEFGQVPEQGKRKDIDEVRDMVKRRLPMRAICESASSYQAIRTAEVMYRYVPLPPRENVQNTWICGPSGSGKSHLARVFAPTAYVKFLAGWWDGYAGEKKVILDDFRAPDSPLSDLLRLMDNWPYRGNIKGSSVGIAATEIIVTSIFLPWELYEGEDWVQLTRRIKLLVVICDDASHRYAHAASKLFQMPIHQRPEVLRLYPFAP